MKKFIFGRLLILGMGLLVVAIIAIKGMQFRAMGKAAEESVMPPFSVSTYTTEKQTWPIKLRALGTIEPVQGVLLEAERAGVVDLINFSNGQSVAEGALLMQLNIEVETAQLKSAQASAKLADIEFNRAKRLLEGDNISQSEFDRATANLDRAKADVENVQAIINRKTIRAPFSGIVGIRQINLGQYVPTGAPMVSLQAHEKVYVNFSLPQQTLAKLKTGLSLSLDSDVFPNRKFSGMVTAISPEIDPATRTIQVQGTLDNKDGALRAGLFVKVAVELPEKDTIMAVPSTAIVYAPYGNSVYVVKGNEETGLKAVQKIIRTGRALGDFVSVLDGLSPGDEVISAGTFKVYNGASLSINNEMAPSPKRWPTPPNS